VCTDLDECIDEETHFKGVKPLNLVDLGVSVGQQLVVLQEVLVHEGLLHLTAEERLDHNPKELRVTLTQEEVQLVAHTLVIDLALLIQ
jgi:hypothetical protein